VTRSVLAAFALLAFASTASAQVVLRPGLRETTFVSPLGVDPPRDIQARIASAPPCSSTDQQGCRENISLAAFTVQATMPYGVGLSLREAGRELVLSVESELTQGVPAEQIPAEFPRAHIRTHDPQGRPETRPARFVLQSQIDTFPEEVRAQLRYQRGANEYVSGWIIAVADPRASESYQWTFPAGVSTDEEKSAYKRQMGCHNCDRPMFLRGKTEADGVFELFTAGESIVVRPQITGSGTNVLTGTRYQYIGEHGRLEARVRTVRSDLTPAGDTEFAVRQAPPSGAVSEHIVSLHNGEVQRASTDLAIKGRGLDFVLMRHYRSSLGSFGPFGRNMDSPLLARVRALPDNSVEYYDGTGTKETFVVSGDRLVGPPGVFHELHRTSSGYFVRYPDDTRLFFDQNGRLTRITDRNKTKSDGTDGNEMRFVHDYRGRLDAVIEPTGREIELAYYETGETGGYPGCIRSVTDFDGRTVTYKYDTSGRMTEVAGPDPESPSSARQTTTYVWSPVSGTSAKQRLQSSGQLTSERDGLARTTYSVTYHPTQPWAAATLTRGDGTWTLSPPAPLMTVTDPLTHATEYTLDDTGRLLNMKEPGDALTRWAYDIEGRLESVTRPLGDGVRYRYQPPRAGLDRRALANVTTITELPRAGSMEQITNQTRVTSIEYGNANLPTKITTPDGATTIIDRDSRGNPKTLTDPAGLTTTFAFDERGLLKSTTDQRTGTTTYAYELSDRSRIGHLRRVTTGAGTTTYDTDARGNTTRVTDPTGKSVAFTVNKLDQVEQEQRDTSVTTMTYDAAGNLSSRNALAGETTEGTPIYSATTYEVDAQGRVRSRSDNGLTTTYGYDPRGDLSTVRRPGTAITTYEYNARGLLERVKDGDRITTYAYNTNAGITSITNARGKVTTFSVNGFGQRTGETDPSGITTANELDQAGRTIDTRTVKTLATGEQYILRWTQFAYDPLGRLTTEIRKLFTEPLLIPETGEPEGATDIVSRTIYEDSAHRVTTIDPRGNETVVEYDALGRLARTVDAMETEVAYEYDAAGNKTKEILTERAPDGTTETFTTIHGYDRQNRLSIISDASVPTRPIVTEYRYDKRGQQTSIVDAEGHVTELEYDLRGNKVKETDPNGGVTEYEYDDAGRLTLLRDANGNETTFAYDDYGQLTSETRADGATWTYTYDESGNRQTTTDANGTVTTNVYDDLDRLVAKQITKAPGVLGPSSITYTLDDLGRIVDTATDEGVTTTTTFDSLDRALTDTIQIGDGPERTVRRAFDEVGNPTGLTYPTGLELDRTFDPLNRLQEVRQRGGAAPIVTYADAGARLVSKLLGNGIAETWTYDPNRRLETITDMLATDVVRRVEYTRSPLGHKRFVNRPDLAKRWAYEYNPNSWITAETIERTDVDTNIQLVRTAWDIDKTLNFRSITRTDQTSGRAETTVSTTTINNRNQYTTFAGSPITYDANGNLTSHAGIAYSYDARNLLARASLANGTVIENLFDPAGRKVREIVSFGGSSRITDYVLDDQQVLEEYVANEPSWRYVRGRGIDEIAQAEQLASPARRLVPLQDELGSVMRLTNDLGDTIESYEYEGYGTPSIYSATNDLQPSSPSQWKWLFQGREYQGLTNSADFRARNLHVRMGRFAQEDPLSESVNPYAAVRGDFAGRRDPSGAYSTDVYLGVDDQPKRGIIIPGQPDIGAGGYAAIRKAAAAADRAAKVKSHGKQSVRNHEYGTWEAHNVKTSANEGRGIVFLGHSYTYDHVGLCRTFRDLLIPGQDSQADPLGGVLTSGGVFRGAPFVVALACDTHEVAEVLAQQISVTVEKEANISAMAFGGAKLLEEFYVRNKSLAEAVDAANQEIKAQRKLELLKLQRDGASQDRIQKTDVEWSFTLSLSAHGNGTIHAYDDLSQNN
jgi:RHS repeat-associated protein